MNTKKIFSLKLVTLCLFLITTFFAIQDFTQENPQQNNFNNYKNDREIRKKCKEELNEKIIQGTENIHNTPCYKSAIDITNKRYHVSGFCFDTNKTKDEYENFICTQEEIIINSSLLNEYVQCKKIKSLIIPECRDYFSQWQISFQEKIRSCSALHEKITRTCKNDLQKNIGCLKQFYEEFLSVCKFH